MTSAFEWTEKKSQAAIALAEGKTQKEIAAELKVSDRTIRNWLAETEFAEEVDRLTLMVGVAGRAERVRIAKRIVRHRLSMRPDGVPATRRDLLDWLKFIQSETDGAIFNLTEKLAAVIEADASMAGQGQESATGKTGEQSNGDA